MASYPPYKNSLKMNMVSNLASSLMIKEVFQFFFPIFLGY